MTLIYHLSSPVNVPPYLLRWIVILEGGLLITHFIYTNKFLKKDKENR